MSYLIDNDILIDALNGQDWAIGLIDRLSDAQIAVSIISYAEVLDGAVGARNPVRQRELAEAFLAPYSVVNLNLAIARRFAELRVSLRRSGQSIPDFDLIIGASAMEHHLTLITRNLRHFQRIPEVTLFDI